MKKRNQKGSSGGYGEGYYVKNETIGYLRQLLFKEKKTTEQLSNVIAQINNNYASVVSSNKLLAESNVNYQTKRTKMQAQLNLYKKKNEDLLSILMKKKIKHNRSFGQLKADEVLRDTKHQPIIEHNDFQMNKCLKSMKTEIEQLTNSLARIATRGFFNRVKNRKNAISYSCPIDYVPKR